MYNFFMNIYIEDFLIQNILINFCLIKLVYLTVKPKSSFFKMICASIIGAGFSVVIAIFLNNSLILNVFKFLCANTMLFIAFKQSKKQYIFSLILLFIYTFALGGLITSLSSSVYYTSFGAVTTSKFSLELICSLIIVVSYVFELVVKHMKLKINTSNLIYKTTLYLGKNSININAYMDTGNFINHNGKPVLILDLNSYLKLSKKSIIDFYLSKTETLQTSTVTGNSNLKLFTIDKISIKNGKKNIILTNQLIAINLNCFKNTNYQALLSPLFL